MSVQATFIFKHKKISSAITLYIDVVDMLQFVSEVLIMLRINLDKLMDSYDITISELSESTGIARSTLTPLIKEPKNIDNVRLKTIDTLCDFFGVSTGTILSFKSIDVSHRYKIKGVWASPNQINRYADLYRIVGSKQRHILIKIDGNITLTTNGITSLRSQITPLNLSTAKKTAKHLSNFETNGLMDGQIFYEDLKKRGDDDFIQSTLSILSTSFLFDPDAKLNNIETKEINEIIGIWINEEDSEMAEKVLKFKVENSELEFEKFDDINSLYNIYSHLSIQNDLKQDNED